MATHSSNLAWETPETEAPGRLRSMGSQRVRHDRAAKPPLPPPVSGMSWTVHPGLTIQES